MCTTRCNFKYITAFPYNFLNKLFQISYTPLNGEIFVMHKCCDLC